MASWCIATNQPAASWFLLSITEKQAFLEVAREHDRAQAAAPRRR